MRGLSLVVASGGHSSSRCAGLSPSRPLLLRSTGSRRTGSAIVAHGPSRSAARGILPDRGSNPCPLHWQADSQPLCHQGSPFGEVLNYGFNYIFLFYHASFGKFYFSGDLTINFHNYFHRAVHNTFLVYFYFYLFKHKKN